MSDYDLRGSDFKSVFRDDELLTPSEASPASPCSPWSLVELEEIIQHAEVHSNYPRSGFRKMTRRQKAIWDSIWQKAVDQADLEENVQAESREPNNQ